MIQHASNSAQQPAGSPELRRRVLLTEVDASRRAAMHMVLEESGYLVTDCSGIAQVMEHAKTVLPQVIILDASLPGDQTRQCIRLLKRCYQTSCVAILLTCDPSLRAEAIAQLMRDGATLVLPRPYTRVKLLEMSALAAKRTEAMAADLAAALGQQTPNARRVKSNNSLLARPVTCPFHDDRPQFDRYLLRPGAVAAHTSFLDLPMYDSTMPGFDRVNYHHLSVMVCPECLFATSHPGFFIDPSEHKERHFLFDKDTRLAISSSAEARRLIAHSRRISSNFFNEHRTATDAILAYELAMRCSEVIYTNNKYSLSTELLRRGNYHLRVAQLLESRGPAASQGIRKHLLAAIAPLRKAEAVLDNVGRYKALYQLLALAITLGEDHAASTYLNRLADQETAAMGENKATVAPYLQRARDAWERRNEHRLPLLLGAAA